MVAAIREACPRAIERVLAIMEDSETDKRTQLEAAKILLDRGIAKLAPRIAPEDDKAGPVDALKGFTPAQLLELAKGPSKPEPDGLDS